VASLCPTVSRIAAGCLVKLGEAAWIEWQGRETVRAVCAENGAKGGAVSARKARVRRMTRDERQELARRDPNRTIHDNEMPF
jgi:hypothetical protein